MDEKPQAQLPPEFQGGTHHISKGQQGPLMKMLGKMLAPKIRMPKSKIIGPQSIKIGRRKKVQQSTVRYW